MKILLQCIVVCFLIVSKSYSQTDSVQTGTIQHLNRPNLKQDIIVSGSFLFIGSAVLMIKSYQKYPSLDNYKSASQYKSDKRGYESRQKTLSLISSVSYFLGGVTIISITFTF
ncbi:MAG: hypothetical protein JWP12_313 [Bacteroidetes bacterium]|nr:hypothetical protein [Bacteroidota bacterium]